ncbi:MAG: hypothetical protein ABIK53_00095 [bacterium]
MGKQVDIASLSVAHIIDRYGVKLTLLIACAILCLSFLIMAQNSVIWLIIATFLIGTGSGIALLSFVVEIQKVAKGLPGKFISLYFMLSGIMGIVATGVGAIVVATSIIGIGPLMVIGGTIAASGGVITLRSPEGNIPIKAKDAFF